MDSIKLQFNTPKLKKLKTVYIVEDNPMESDMLTDFFSRYKNLTIKTFLNGDACIKDVIVSKVSPDLIFIDYFLDASSSSSKDGLEILSKLREVSPNSECVMLTSVDNERIMELASKKGAMSYIVKGAEGYKKLESIVRSTFSVEEIE